MMQVSHGGRNAGVPQNYFELDGLWHVYFGSHQLGYLHDDLGKVEDRAGFISRHNRKLSAMSPDKSVSDVSERSDTDAQRP